MTADEGVRTGTPARYIARITKRLGTIEPGEGRVAFRAALYFFFVLASYYILRPVRDQVGVAAGVRTLPWLFTGTVTATLLLNPVFSKAVAHWPVRRFIPIVYRTFALLLLGFAALVHWAPDAWGVWMRPAFWIWTAVFALFVPSVFWGFMADTFRPDQGKRLYGMISVGGTLGALAGSGITALLATVVGTPVLMLISIVLLESGVQVVRRFPQSFREETRVRDSAGSAIGGSALSGITHVLRSPYLLGICAFMLLFTIGSTVLYFQQTEIVGRVYSNRESQTAFLASMDFAVQLLTVLSQLFLTGRVIRWLGVGLTLAVLPILSMAGFAALGIETTLALFVVFNVLRRVGNYAFTNPAREVLFTVVTPEDKYKAKNFIDTFVYRAGDQIGAWGIAGFMALGMSLSMVSLAAVPLSALWLGISVWLGRQQSRLETSRQEA